MAAEGLPVELACRVLDVSASGFYAWRSGRRRQRSIRHAWLTDLIREVHLGLPGHLRRTARPRRAHPRPGLVVGRKCGRDADAPGRACGA